MSVMHLLQIIPLCTCQQFCQALYITEVLVSLINALYAEQKLATSTMICTCLLNFNKKTFGVAPVLVHLCACMPFLASLLQFAKASIK